MNCNNDERRIPKFKWLSLILLFFLTGSVISQTPWKDPSPHHVSFVAVEKGVKLEVLDWGGHGRPVVLLAGGGNTAHVFDDFAPKLTSHYHVYGITRRGFGASGYAAPDNVADRMGEDVLSVIDSLHLRRPVLIGHSIAGVELSWMANHHPERVAGLIYLDAGYFYAFDNGKGADPTNTQAPHAPPPQPPLPNKSDLASFSALAKYSERVNGFPFPEAELRQHFEMNPDGTVGAERPFPGDAMFTELQTGAPKYTAIPVQALFIFANPHSLGPLLEHSTDASVRSPAKAYSAGQESLTEKQVNAVKNGVPAARVISIPNADHYVFLSNETQVLREIRAFISKLP